MLGRQPDLHLLLWCSTVQWYNSTFLPGASGCYEGRLGKNELHKLRGVKFGSLNVQIRNNFKTSLLRRLQAQTLPDEAPPIGKIHRFSKMAVTFEPLIGF